MECDVGEGDGGGAGRSRGDGSTPSFSARFRCELVGRCASLQTKSHKYPTKKHKMGRTTYFTWAAYHSASNRSTCWKLCFSFSQVESSQQSGHLHVGHTTSVGHMIYIFANFFFFGTYPTQHIFWSKPWARRETLKMWSTFWIPKKTSIPTFTTMKAKNKSQKMSSVFVVNKVRPLILLTRLCFLNGLHSLIRRLVRYL